MAKIAVRVTWEEFEATDYEHGKWVPRKRAFATVARFAEWLLEEQGRDVPWSKIRINGEPVSF